MTHTFLFQNPSLHENGDVYKKLDLDIFKNDQAEVICSHLEL